ncbi:hypothetical protein [Streptomyces sp. NPDC051561]|uniref:hypothetical protein n=1 Tax=Streptomyces sp. NPDC051561 TaxID=3365658 RepID=UPI0037B7C83C
MTDRGVDPQDTECDRRGAHPTARWLAEASDTPDHTHAEWADRGVALLPLGRRFDAVRVPGELVRAALAANGSPAGPLILDPHSAMYYALVPPRTTETWVCAFGTCLGQGAWLGVPHPERVGPPGPHWVTRGDRPTSLCRPSRVRELIELGCREVEGATALPREWCAWCKQETGRPTTVGILHAGTGGGGHLHACPTCLATYRLLSLTDHPADSDGTPRHQPTHRSGTSR